MKRIQRLRKKGWQMPPNTKYVGRPTKFGNPFRLTSDGYIQFYKKEDKKWILFSYVGGATTETIVLLYALWITGRLSYIESLPEPPDAKELLKYDNLACWCPLHQPCHVDVLLELLTITKK
ncbi:MAG: DUF4326 domain-containing protein [Chloroflexi bacterium]|nr:MAG: DUF4326 domain-containing protein [Chloroflexota bacterium]